MITAIILAAGESKRMGQPKMLLPWEKGTVISHVVSIFQEAGVDNIVVVTGGAKEQVENALTQLKVKTVYNEAFAVGGMLSSIQCGLQVLTSQTQAILVGLGDQPQVQAGSVRKVCEAYYKNKSKIVVPSFHKRRGHPWLVARPLWDGILNLESSHSPRDFLNSHSELIEHVTLDDPGVVEDLDTPEDYQRWQPQIP